MITKNDVMLLLSDLEDNGIQTKDAINSLIASRDVPLSVLKFINEHRTLDLTNFYDKLRRSYNNKHSKLYISIVRDIKEPIDVLTTLSSLNLQILLYSKQASDRTMFLKHARAKEISMVLTKYFTDYDLTNCLKLLQLRKADLVATEYISGRRNEEL